MLETQLLTTLHALIIEDNPVDTELFAGELRKAGYDVVWNRAFTESEYISHLKQFPDIIIADYSSPQFEVSRALKILKEKGLNIPLIIITGTIDEKTALECIEKGASDYLFRDRLGRLGHSVEQALRKYGTNREHGVADETQRKGEETYRTILENIQDGYFEVDLIGNFTFFNHSTCEIFGYSSDELMGMNNKVYTTPETAKKIYTVYNTMYRTGETSEVTDYEIIRKDGSPIILEVSSSPSRDGSGAIVGFHGILRDVTKHRRAEEALRDSEEKYRSIIENIQEGYFEADLAGNFTFCNDVLCVSSGYSRGELMSMDFREYTTPESAENIFYSFHNIYLTKKPSEIVPYEFMTKDGQIRHAELSASLIVDSEGSPLGFRGVARDVTARRETEESWRRYDFIVNTSRDWMSLINKNYFFEAVNESFCRAWGKNRQEILGRSVADILGEKIFETEIMDHLYRCLRGEESRHHIQLELVPSDSLFFDVNYYPYRDQTGMTTHAVVTFQDITKRKQAEEKIESSFATLHKTLEGTIDALGFTLQTRDPFTAGHQRRVAELSCRIARAMNYDENDITALRLSSLVHDIGKIYVPNEILSRPGKITDIEFDIIKTH
ncbi:MAG: PAS domain S-box protein, partial [Syntrophobacterales bacterium]